MKRFSWSFASDPTPPSVLDVLPIELVLVVFIILVASARILVEAPTILFQAHFVELLNTVRVQQIAIVEHHAITGRALESDAAYLASSGAGASAGGDYESRLSGRSLSLIAPSDEPAVRARSQRVRTGVVQGTIIGIGRSVGDGKPFQVSMRTAWDPGEARATLQWVCGNAPVPQGMIATPATTLSTLPSQLLPSTCRGERP
ncbi:MAG TPA: hypothetical protein VLT89_11145 [Usitatibacter sp.]|nr:hypothetical protein [Usitatibacter sp.]